MIIAIDGPAGSGKSTTARAVAERLGYVYVDTGAMYRAVALAFIRSGRSAETPSGEDLRALLADIRLDMHFGPDGMRILLNGRNVTAKIRTPQVTETASRVAAIPAVRERMVKEQRRIAHAQEKKCGGVVLEGRDIGTIVFPNAEVKVFMDAGVTMRARRRYDELREKNLDISFEEVLNDIRARDERDIYRQVSPLRKTEGAVEIDTSHIAIREQVDMVVQAARERMKSPDV